MAVGSRPAKLSDEDMTWDKMGLTINACQRSEKDTFCQREQEIVLVSINNNRELPAIWPVNLGFSMVNLTVLSGDKIPGQCESLTIRL